MGMNKRKKTDSKVNFMQLLAEFFMAISFQQHTERKLPDKYLYIEVFVCMYGKWHNAF